MNLFKNKEKQTQEETKSKAKKRIVQSTQQNIPVKEIIGNAIVTEDDRIYKVIEVLPSDFFLKKENEQNQIAFNFQTVLNYCPNEVHIKSISTHANLAKQKNNLLHHLIKETNDNCKTMMKEFYNTLTKAEIYGIQRRYFISFPYDSVNDSKSVIHLNEAIDTLNSVSTRVARSLDECGNAAIINNDYDNESLLYMLLNRKSFTKIPYDEHKKKTIQKYQQSTMQSQPFIPTTDLICANNISFENKKYVVCDGIYYSFLFIPSTGYPTETIPGWLEFIVNSYVGVDVDIFLTKDKTMTEGKLRRLLGHNEADIEGMSRSSQGFRIAARKNNAIQYIYSCIDQGQSYYNMSTIVTVTGYSPEEVDDKVKNIISVAESKYGTILYPLINQEEQAFKSVLPCSTLDKNIFNKSRRNVVTEGAADNYIFTSAELIDDNGIYFADNTTNQSPIILNSFNEKKYKNAHKFICGETGSGKSVTVMSIASKNRAYHRPVYILSPYKQHEFARLCEEMGGEFVSIGTGSKNILNPLEIFPLSSRSLEIRKTLKDDAEDYSLLLQKISMVSSFIRIKYPDMNSIEEEILEDTLLELYAKFGITEDNESLWNENKTAFKKMPILSDLYESMLTKGNDAKQLVTTIKSLTVGKAKHFNGHTNFNVDNDFFVIGLEHNSDDVTMMLSYFLAMEFIWQKVQENPLQEKSFVTDEWWILAKNKVSADRSLQIAKLSRAYRCEMIIATQQMSDADSYGTSEYGKKVLDACETKILLKMGENDFNYVTDKLNLTEVEQNIIKKAGNGNGLYITPYVRIPIYFNLSEREKLLYFTDKETIEKYEKMQKYKEVLSQTEEMSSLFENKKKETYSVFGNDKTYVSDMFEDNVPDISDIFN